MSEPQFPSTSSHFFELDEQRYDVDQLMKGVDAAIKAKNKAREDNITTFPPTPTQFHLHACSIETSLQAPAPFVYYWGQQERPNPSSDLFDQIRQKISSAVDPFTPLTLATCSPDSLRPDTIAPGGFRFHGTKLYMPGAHQRKHMARLDPLPNTQNKEWAPSANAWDIQNWLQAVIALDPKSEPTRKAMYRDDTRRFALSTDIQMSWIPDGEGEDAGVVVKLLVTINVFVDLDTIFLPLPEVGNDMLGLIFHSLIPSPTSATFTNDSEARAAALRDFYACLKPAPDLPLNYSANLLQPKEMVSRLLPFQTRTVYLLLQREQSHHVSSTSSAGSSDPEGFWKAYDFGLDSGRVGFRRFTGDLRRLGGGPVKADIKGKGRAIEGSPERDLGDLTAKEKANVPAFLNLSGVRGTMLCEEMGLGKTVEVIALVLLHRHPVSRPRIEARPVANDASTCQDEAAKADQKIVPVIDLLQGTPGMEDPNINQWVNSEHTAFAGRRVYDAQAELHVTEVATTLIVTPPSLLRQWVSEMQRHAPTLRVCVYEGWKSLQKGVETQRYARLKAQKLKAEAERKRKFTELRDKTRAKYAKGANGTRVKTEDAAGGTDLDKEAHDEVRDDENGIEEESTLEITQRQFVEYVRAHDIVVTTYQDLSQDLKVALPVPPRSRRATANYQLSERPRSPLVMVEWWRVIMDEVQLHGDATDAANMVSLIPRKNSLAVSGTPAKSDIKDLMGSLKFLRVPVLPHDSRLWHRLQQSGMRQAFESLFRTIAVRTTKKGVSGEFNLPHQTRFVFPIELSQIELHYYNDTLERFRDRLHLPENPRAARPANWVLDRALFIVTLRNLRQICTHIQVGQMQGAVHKGEQRLNLGRSLMTMTEALEKMKNDHTQDYLLESRQQMRMMIKKAQLSILNETDDLRYLTALKLYEKVRATCTKQLEPVREHLKTLLDGREDIGDSDHGMSPDRNQSQQDREKALQITAARQTIREMSIILHEAWFFEGDVRHVQKETEDEINCYAQADLIRKDILKRPLQTANLSVESLQRSLAHTAALHDVEELQTEDTTNRGGMLSTSIITQVNDLLEILNDNAYLVFDWRTKILALLSSPIDTESNEVPGQGTDVENPEVEYYAEALKAQGEVEAYLIAFAAAIADRKEFLIEDRSLLAAHDAKQTKQRGTKAAINAMADAAVLDVSNDVKDQAEELMQERNAFRNARVEKGCERPLKGLLIDLNAIINGPNRSEEIVIASQMVKMLRAYIRNQTEYVDKLNAELDLFRATFNRRVVYFAALQEISDSVTAPEFKDLQKDIDACSRTIDELEVKLSRMVVKGRYLQYLGNKDQDAEDIREDCIICFGSSDAKEAVLLECGHYFCLPCYREFRKSPMGRKCPSCRIEIDAKVTRVKVGDSKVNDAGDSSQTTKPSIEGGNESESQDMSEEYDEDRERERRNVDLRRLKMVDDVKRREVTDMDMLGEYGSKINFLVKHLLYYKSREPDARHVIFSNWSDSLNIVMQALRHNNITFSSFDQGKRQKDVVDQFLKDSTISVFLLHAERESSGLTLTSCRIVHLLEPVLRHSFELQAIGRVDRLGQDKETTVYCYATMETVEARILSQGVRNGTSIYLDDENADGAVADMPNLASAASKGGDVGGDANEEDLLGLIL